MSDVKIDYDEDADVLYVSFGRSEHVTGIELADNVLLRIDTGKVSQSSPRAVGLTFISFKHMMDHYRGKPLLVPLENLRNLPEDIWQAVVTVVTSPPVSDYLNIGLSLSLQAPPLPQDSAL